MSEPKFKVGDKVMLESGSVGEIINNIMCSDGKWYYRIQIHPTQTDIWAENKIELVRDYFSDGADIEEKWTQAPVDFIDFVCNKLNEVKELFQRKNQQYSVGADPLANFRAGALLRAGNDSYAEMYEEAKNYRRKHVVHIERNGIAADKGDESLDDTIVYSAIMAYMRHCHEQEGCAK